MNEGLPEKSSWYKKWGLLCTNLESKGAERPPVPSLKSPVSHHCLVPHRQSANLYCWWNVLVNKSILNILSYKLSWWYLLPRSKTRVWKIFVRVKDRSKFHLCFAKFTMAPGHGKYLKIIINWLLNKCLNIYLVQ